MSERSFLPAVLCLVLFIPCGRIALTQTHDDSASFLSGELLGPDQAAVLESSLPSKPDDEDVRIRLLGFECGSSLSRQSTELRRKCISQSEWLIEHVPESPLFRYGRLRFTTGDFPPGDPEYARIVALWDKQVAAHTGNASILHNAAISFYGLPISMKYGLQLRAADPYDVQGVLTTAIAVGVVMLAVENRNASAKGTDEGLSRLAAAMTGLFDRSTDAALIGASGKSLLDVTGRMHAPDSQAAAMGKHWLERANMLDPTNPKWLKAVTAPDPPATTESELEHLARWLEEEDLWRGRVVPAPSLPNHPAQISATEAWHRQYQHIFGVDLDNLQTMGHGIHKAAEPDMPAQRDGEVKMALLVDEQGHILRSVPLSGNAEHIQIADSDLSTWRFHPWTLEGRAVPFESVMTMHFQSRLWGPVAMGAPPTLEQQVSIGERISGDQPVYPLVAKAARVEGTVRISATITPEGKVESPSVVDGPPLLQKAALDAVSTWKYKPFLSHGKPVTVKTMINVVFRLDQSPAPGKVVSTTH